MITKLAALRKEINRLTFSLLMRYKAPSLDDRFDNRYAHLDQGSQDSLDHVE